MSIISLITFSTMARTLAGSSRSPGLVTTLPGRQTGERPGPRPSPWRGGARWAPAPA
jgi:hypothetical protein